MSLEASRRISVSFLNSLTNPRLLWLRKTKPELFENEEDTHLRIGRAVDCLLTNPNKWQEEFQLLNAFKPTGAMATFIRALPKGLNPDSDKSHYEKAYALSGYKRSIDWVINSLWSNPKNVEYYLELSSITEGKTPISKDELEQVQKCVMAIEENIFAKRYFIPCSKREKIFQPRIEFDLITDKGAVPCTAILDGIIVDHEEKTIEPFDLKTTSKSVWDFPNSFIHNGYFRQAAFYSIALYAQQSPVKQYLEQDYKVKPFSFVVVETRPNAYGPVLLYEVKDQWLDKAFNGFTLQDRYYKGINELIDDFYWHVENNVWFLPKEVYLNEGRVYI